MKEVIYSSLLLILLASCSNAQNAIRVTLEDSDSPIIFRYDTINDKILGVQIPLTFNIRNTSFQKRKLSIDYFYNNGCREQEGWGYSKILYLVKDKKNMLVGGKGGNKDKTINPFQTKTYTLYSVHRIDSTQACQQLFTPYIERLRTANRRKLEVEPLQDFKLKHPDIVNTFLQGDSIEFLFRPATKKEPMIQILWPVDTDDEKEMEYIYNVF